MSTLVYDSGALIAAERSNRRLWLLHERALRRGVKPIVPTPVIAETVYPGMPNISRLLIGCDVEALDAESAIRSGRLRHLASGTVVDAVIVEAALRRSDHAVVTSDRGDIEALAAAARRKITIIDI